MNLTKWILFCVAIGMMAATSAFIATIRTTERLGAAGVRVGSISLYDPAGKRIATHSVILPDTVLGAKSIPEPVTDVEVSDLPSDTTFGRRRYLVDKDFAPIIGAVLMGTDRNSIHQPEFCLIGQGWTLDQKDKVFVHVKQPYAYDFPAIRFTTSMEAAGPDQKPMLVRGIYLYWFVTDRKIAAEHATRLWSIAQTMVEKRELERWAYISYFVTCFPGQEQATYSRLENFIQSSAPDVQIVTGESIGRSSPVAVRE